MPLEHPSPRYADFRQAVRRYPPSLFLPALAAHTAVLDPLIRPATTSTHGRWPWAASAMARESVLHSNEYRHGGVPTENDFARLYNLFNDSFDEGEKEESVSDIVTPLVYEQFGYGESPFEELGRVWALFGDPTLGGPVPWQEVFGMSLAEAGRAAFVLHAWVCHNAGQIDYALFDSPHMQEVFRRVAPRNHLRGLADRLTMTVAEAKALNAEAPAVAPHRQRFAFNPFVPRPLIRFDDKRAYAPQSMLVSRAVFPNNLYYFGLKQWGKPFADNLGLRVEQYVGRQLRLIGGEAVQGEIEYAKGQKTVDWIWVSEQAVVLVECKSARLTLGAKAADESLGGLVERSLGKARRQIDRTADLIQAEHPALQHIPNDRPIIGLAVTAEPFYFGNSSMPEYGIQGKVPSQTVSLRELEHFVCLPGTEASSLLLSVLNDAEKRTWALSSVMKELPKLPKNPILEEAWMQYDFIDGRPFGSTNAAEAAGKPESAR